MTNDISKLYGTSRSFSVTTELVVTAGFAATQQYNKITTIVSVSLYNYSVYNGARHDERTNCLL